MRVFLFGTSLLVSFCLESRAQDSTFNNVKLFPESALLLTSGIMLNGTLRLYPEAESVSITCANDSTYTLPARLVQGFAVKDPLLNQLPTRDTYLSAERVFRVLPLVTDNRQQVASCGFYEQLSQGPGPVLLLRREKAVPDNMIIPRSPIAAGYLSTESPDPLSIKVYTSANYQTTLYLRATTGKIILLRKPRKLLKYLPQQAPLLRAYARENDLDYSNLRDLSFLVNYVNTLLKIVP